MDIKELKKFPEYRHLNDDYVTHPTPPVVESKVVEEDKDNILNLVFAPDPLSGIPRSDIAIMMSRDARPEVAQYIQDTLMRGFPDTSSAGVSDEDGEFALDSVRSRGEGLREYASRLRDIVAKYSHSEKGSSNYSKSEK